VPVGGEGGVERKEGKRKLTKGREIDEMMGWNDPSLTGINWIRHCAIHPCIHPSICYCETT